MTAYALIVITASGAIAARGFPATALGLSIGLLAVGAALEASYLVRRRSDRVLSHRRGLDRVVRAQWIGIGVLGSLIAVAVGHIDPPPLAHTAEFVQTLVVGVAIAVPAIYVSSIVDWYWVLPKVSGMAGVAPCERVGGEGFAGVTKIWLFHRAAATAIVTVVLAAVPGYMAGTTGDGSESAAWVILGSALAIGYNSVNTGLTTAFRYAFNPELYVGDIIRVRADPEDAGLKDAYVVDVSIQGLKYKLVEDALRGEPCFLAKGEPLRIDDIATTRRSRQPRPPCPSVASCQAANWYCFRNPNAHVARASDAVAPLPWEPTAS
jgi:hypothetical protein